MKLELADLRRFIENYIEVVRLIDVMNHVKEDLSNPLLPENQRLKQVQIPVSVSESIAFYCILNNPGLINVDDFIPEQLLMPHNLKEFDIVYDIEGKNRRNIEVKGSGITSGFQKFRTHALEANFVFWLKLNTNEDSSYQFDLAVFDPQILKNLINDKNREVLISWEKLVTGFSDKIILELNITI